MVCALGAAASSAAADDGRITFTGTISDVTCTVTGGGATVTAQSAGNFTVGLPRVSATALAANGERAGDTPFWMRLSGTNCTNGKVASVYFEPAQSTNIDQATGNLRNATGTGRATRVQVGLLNGAKSVMNLFTSTPTSTATIANNAAQFDYWAQYVATGGAATAGTVSTDVVYSIIYN
ncbi:type 1 fimbrial protein [Cupriavidus campinensis]|nr:type 1 fimbrial protein [Cupriavidus campinensis]